MSHETYVIGHAYAGAALKHVVELSVRTIEHGNLIDDETAAVMAKHNTYAMPTPVEYDAMGRVGARVWVSESALKKNDDVRAQGLRTLDILECHGVKIGVRTDLLGDMPQFQSEELSVRSTIVGAFETICQATKIGAEIVGMEVR